MNLAPMLPLRRLSLAMAAVLLSANAGAAAEWDHYINDRFGFSIDIPSGFVAQGESFNGDGNRFTTPTAELRAFGGNIFVGEQSFETEVGYAIEAATGDGWTMTYKAVTPRNANLSARKGARVLYERLVAICGGQQFIGFTLDYSVADLVPFKPVIDRLLASLRPPASC
ncbi:MAG: hypothetical protein ABI697_02680 [Devosia sp.]